MSHHSIADHKNGSLTMNATFKLRVEMLEDRKTPALLSFPIAQSPVLLIYDTDRTVDVGQFRLDPPVDKTGIRSFYIDESGGFHSSTTPAFQSALAAYTQNGVTFSGLVVVPPGLLIAAAPDSPTR